MQQDLLVPLLYLSIFVRLKTLILKHLCFVYAFVFFAVGLLLPSPLPSGKWNENAQVNRFWH